MTDVESMAADRVSCEVTARHLYDFLDRRLSGDVEEHVTRHLAHCQECARHFEFARALLARIPAALHHDDVSPALRARILDALRREGFTG